MNKIITVTGAAHKQLYESIKDDINTLPNVGIRIQVLPGGCAGFKYDFVIVDNPFEDDNIEEHNGIKFYIDPFTTPHIKGTVIDFKSTLTHSGFTFDNPNAKSSCGCNTSFNTEDKTNF